MIHGLLSNKNIFNYYISELEQYYDVINSIDLPGHGNNKMDFSSENIKKFVLSSYDEMKKKCECIDVIGYSLGGVVSCYLQSKRKINKMVLLAPSYRYFNLKNFKIKKGNVNRGRLKGKSFLNLVKFFKINSDLKGEVNKINVETIILWGKDDYLVKESSGLILYKMIEYKNKQFVKLDNHNHYNIVNSKEALDIIKVFVKDV